MNFDLTAPCAQCPFRTDIPGFLRPSRAEEIANSLLAGETFPCHKTCAYDDDGNGHPTATSQHCAGALIFLERFNRPNQMMRIAERLGFYDRKKLDMTAPVVQTRAEWVLHMEKTDER